MLTQQPQHELRAQLVKLRCEHRELDEQIAALMLEGVYDQLLVSRLKKRKLHIKDMIQKINSALIPDMNA
ncbi:MAG: DUF465 domain-containing protein [Thiofilum sp.]|uniref:YdcH family protein n=1 Tax=Thiofilum sp. TaxID=2212733 RepID=UPI0025F6AA0C|nr:DUF465 domain-containing protein [Thiofilum sp.]MBK8453222.1 DUF465 domain-containing protein [Thiofilum sp.]